MVVYLPNEDYNSLKLSTLSGDVIVSDVFSFSEADIKSVSGDVEYSAFTDNLLNIKSTSGDIECMSEAKDVRLKTTSGNITFSICDIKNGTVEIKTTSGTVVGSTNCELNYITDTVSGDINVPKSVEGAS